MHEYLINHLDKMYQKNNIIGMVISFLFFSWMPRSLFGSIYLSRGKCVVGSIPEERQSIIILFIYFLL